MNYIHEQTIIMTILIYLIISIATIIFFYLIDFKSLFKSLAANLKKIFFKKAAKEKLVVKKSSTSLTELESTLKFLNELIIIKSEEIIEIDVLPLYAADKTLDKTKVKELKTKIFFEISLFLNAASKNILKKYFNEDGIKRHIQYEFLKYLNKIDRKQNKKQDKIDIQNLTTMI
jgi:hypothetical protein